jgi:hypothetical protein
MKKPTPQINRPGSKPVVPVAKKPEAPAEVEIPAAEGLTVVEGQEYTVEETASEQPSLTIPEDPLPSAPVEEPVVQTPAPVVQDGMAYLGTFVLDGMVSRGNNGRVASLPVVVVSGGRVIGVLAVSDPGLIGDALAILLQDAGYGSEFEFRTVGQLDRLTKLAAAKALSSQQDVALDRVGAVMSLGFNPSSIA